MWDFGSVWATDGRSTSMASYHAMVHEIHVLLVDHDTESLMNTAKVLEMCAYRVTFVELASAAISMLVNGKAKFDLIMANVNSPDLHGFKLLQQAVNMDLPVILMSVDDNTFMAMRALESGAFLFIKKPATMEILRCLWQHVFKDKERKMREKERFREMAANYGNVRGIEFRELTYNEEDLSPTNPGYNSFGGSNLGISMMMMKHKGKSKKKFKGLPRDEDYDSENHLIINSNNKVKRKVCTEWTQELHSKFMDAVRQLGEGRCFPKEILELMNTPGLTRMQVASHLQKCRNDNWRSPEERKSHQISLPQESCDNNGLHHKPRRFGSMPQVDKNPSHQIQVQENPGSEQTSDNEMTDVNGGNGNMGNPSPVVNNNNSSISNSTPHPQPYGPLVPVPSKASRGGGGGGGGGGRRHPSDDFFNFPDMDCLIQNFSHGTPQGSGMNNQNSGSGPNPYHFDPVYPEQNSVVPSNDNRSQWSPETSNFESEGSETRENENN